VIGTVTYAIQRLQLPAKYVAKSCAWRLCQHAVARARIALRGGEA
jgi:hypothetical protein